MLFARLRQFPLRQARWELGWYSRIVTWLLPSCLNLMHLSRRSSMTETLLSESGWLLNLPTSSQLQSCRTAQRWPLNLLRVYSKTFLSLIAALARRTLNLAKNLLPSAVSSGVSASSMPSSLIEESTVLLAGTRLTSSLHPISASLQNSSSSSLTSMMRSPSKPLFIW